MPSFFHRSRSKSPATSLRGTSPNPITVSKPKSPATSLRADSPAQGRRGSADHRPPSPGATHLSPIRKSSEAPPPGPSALKRPSIAHQRTPSDYEEIHFTGTFGGKLDNKPSRGSDISGRRSSIKFNTYESEATIRRDSVRRQSNAYRRSSVAKLYEDGGRARRGSGSPPPPRKYQRGVSFDTFANGSTATNTLTQRYKHADYLSKRRGDSRTFLCGVDGKDYSDNALEWLMEELLDDGDEVVCLRAVKESSKLAQKNSIEHKTYLREAEEFIEKVKRKNAEKDLAISIVVDLAVGPPESVILQMIQIYEPHALVVGTRGSNQGTTSTSYSGAPPRAPSLGSSGLAMDAFRSGSVSKWCLQESPVAVIVIPPEWRSERERRQLAALSPETSFQEYPMAHAIRSNSVIGPLPEATEEEAEAVANAIGVTKDKYTGQIGKQVHRRRSTSMSAAFVDSLRPDMDIDKANAKLPSHLRRLSGSKNKKEEGVPASALDSPLMEALVWDDSDDEKEAGKMKLGDKATPITESPKSDRVRSGAGSDAETDDDSKKVKKEEEEEWQHRRPSTPRSADPDWLAGILGTKEPTIKKKNSSGLHY